MRHYGRKFQTFLKVHIRFTPQKSCILLGRGSTKVVQRIVKFQILGFDNFCFVSVNMGQYGSKSFKRHLLWRNTSDLLPKIHVYFWGGSLPKLLNFIVKFEIFCFKMAGCRAKRSEIWDSRILATHIWCIFDLVVFKAILGSFRAFVSK